jgi:hypothetical protein
VNLSRVTVVPGPESVIREWWSRNSIYVPRQIGPGKLAQSDYCSPANWLGKPVAARHINIWKLKRKTAFSYDIFSSVQNSKKERKSRGQIK